MLKYLSKTHRYLLWVAILHKIALEFYYKLFYLRIGIYIRYRQLYIRSHWVISMAEAIGMLKFANLNISC